MIVCNRCGKENQDHYKFCLGCGAELTSPAKPGGDIAVMKTMMADSSSLGPGSPMGGPMGGPRPGGGTPSPFGAPMPGMPAPAGAPPAGMAPMPGMPPRPAAPGPLGGMPGPGPLGGAPFPGAPMPGAPMGGAPMGGAPFGAPPSVGPPAGPPPGVPGGAPGFPAPGFGGGPSGPAPAPFGAPASVAPAAGPRRCPACNTEVPPGFRFCGACGQRMDEGSGASPMPMPPPGMPGMGAPMSAPQPVAPPQPRAMITLIRPDGSEGGTFELKQGENKIGRTFAPIFENDGYLSPTHADLSVMGLAAVVRDLGSLNGVFVKMTDEEEIQPGQVFRIGQELLRFDLVTAPEPMPDGTEVMGSPNPGYWGKITVIIGKDVDGSAYPLLGESITLGRERGEINFPDDGYVSGLHARVSTRDGKVYLTDLGSSNGTFFKIASERKLKNESFVLLGQQLFRLNLS